VTRPVVKSVDEIPAVCLEEDLVNVFRLSSKDVRFWRKYPEFLPFPPLPFLDRQIRVSGCVVAWFLAQELREYYRNFETPLREHTKGMRSKTRPPWWKFAPPHAQRYWATPLDGEKPTLKLDDVAKILRTTPSVIRRATRASDFPMPPAGHRPLRWTEGQIERLLWAPQDHEEHLQKTTPKSGNRRRFR
jgi:hypothetical protein